METLTRSLNYELPQYAQHILENSHTPNLADTTTITLASTPSISSLEATATTHQTTTSEFLKKLGATFIHSIQLQSLHKANPLESSFSSVPALSTSSSASLKSNMDLNLEYAPHGLIIDSRTYNTAMDELQKQLDYDKFMNEVWIGVVLTLILISMIFCLCSCFLYHQFRMWKRNYSTTVTQSSDVESSKLNMDFEDPVPEYTLVSGLPSYEAALELLHKTPQSCLIVHPSVFEIFNRNEKAASEDNPLATESIPSSNSEVSEPLLTEDNKSNLPSYTEATTPSTPTLPYNHSLANLLSPSQQKSQPKSKSSTTSTTTKS